MRTFSAVSLFHRVLWTTVFAVLCLNQLFAAEDKQIKFDLLKVGAETYSNATVTLKGDRSIFVVHAGGMQSVSLTNLEAAVLVQLGYRDPHAPLTNAAVAWVKSHVPAVELPKMEEMRQYVPQRLEARLPHDFDPQQFLSVRNLSIAGGILLGLHLICSLLLSLICRNAGAPGSLLIWFPIIQFVPIFKAAKMSPWWTLALFVPLLNLVGLVMWSFKIVRACGKNAGVGILLLLPFLNLFALLYLAFSHASRSSGVKLVSRKIQILGMEAS